MSVLRGVLALNPRDLSLFVSSGVIGESPLSVASRGSFHASADGFESWRCALQRLHDHYVISASCEPARSNGTAIQETTSDVAGVFDDSAK